MQPVNLLSMAEAKMARSAEIEPIILSKIEAINGICAAASSADPEDLARHLGLGDVDRAFAEGIMWKALLTLRIEVDDTAASIAIVLSSVLKIYQAAHQQRDLALHRIEQLAQDSQARMMHYSNLAANAGNLCKELLQSQGVELDVPPEMMKPSTLVGGDGAQVTL